MTLEPEMGRPFCVLAGFVALFAAAARRTCAPRERPRSVDELYLSLED